MQTTHGGIGKMGKERIEFDPRFEIMRRRGIIVSKVFDRYHLYSEPTKEYFITCATFKQVSQILMGKKH